MKDLTLEILVKEWSHWWLREHDLRFGQYIFNNYIDEGNWPELFYEEDNDKAFAMLVEYVVDESTD